MLNETISLYTLNNRIGSAIYSDSGTQNVWVTAELSDVSNKNGHTYMELIEKDSRGTQIAKAKAMIWRTNYDEILRFQQQTGQNFCSGIKLKVFASATMHPRFGLSLTITKIDPTFTMGDLLIRRREILEQLQKEGVLEDNRQLSFDSPNLRVAVISAPEAAGYGDFHNHLSGSGIKYRYVVKLFPAIMQGEKTVPTVLDAFEKIEDDLSEWDCVVLIRGGGATSDLVSFESYDLAYRIATFPLPVIVGIGHERDVTVLDYVAHTRVKTPTAAAGFLIRHWDCQLQKITDLMRLLTDSVKEKVNAEILHLSYMENNIGMMSTAVIDKINGKLDKHILNLESICSKRISPQRISVDNLYKNLCDFIGMITEREKRRLEGQIRLLEALSPMAVLKRGYTITLKNGKAVKSSKDVDGTGIEFTTVFHDGNIISKTI